MFTRMTDVMDNGTNSTILFYKEFPDIMKRTNIMILNRRLSA